MDSSPAMSNTLAMAAHRASIPCPATSLGTLLTEDGRTTNDSAMFAALAREDGRGAGAPDGDAATTPGLAPRALSGRIHDSSTPAPAPDEPSPPCPPAPAPPSPSSPVVTSKIAAHAWHLKSSLAGAPSGAATGGGGDSVATDMVP